jgi:hypothetical protein
MFGQGSLAGAARVVLGLDNRDFNRDLIASERQFQRSTRTMERDAGQMARGVAAGTGALGGFARAVAFASASFLGAAGFTALVRQSINAASDLAESINAAEATFRSGAPAMRAWAENASTALGMSERAALANATSIGAMLIPMGYVPGQAAGMSQAMVQLATDMASFNNQDPSEMLDRIRSGLAGESEPLRRFGVDLRETAVQAFALRKGFIEQGETLTAQGQIWARYQLILEQTKIQQGDFGRTADGAANQQRTLRAAIEEAEAALGGALLPTVEELLPKLTDWADSLAENEELQADLTAAVEGGADAVITFANAAEDVVDALGGWENAFELLLSGAIARSLTKVIGQPGGGAAGTSAAGASGLLGITKLLRGIGLLGVIHVGVEIATNWDDVKKELHDELGNPEWWKAIFTRGVFGFLEPVIGSSNFGTAASGDPARRTPGGRVADPRGGVGGGSIGTLPGTGQVSVSPRRIPVGQGAAPIKPHVIAFVKQVAGVYGSSLTIWDNSTHNKYVSGTNNTVVSQHWSGDAADVPASGAELTRLGQSALIAAGMSPAAASRETGGAYNVGGVNILFNTNIGGNHFDHLHVGLTSLPTTRGGGRDTKVDPVEEPDDLGRKPSPRKKKPPRKSTARPEDPILEGLYLRLTRSEDTRRQTDDLKALDALIAYLNKKALKEKDAGDKAALIRERQGLQRQRTSILDEIQESRPLPKPVRIPGVDAVLGEFGRIQTGTAIQDLGGALGKVLVPNALNPTIQAWANMESKLRKKLRAAVGRRNALQRALNRLGRVRGPLRDKRMIQWHQQQIAAINEKIADLRDAIGASIAAQADLRAEATSRAQEEAEEAERVDQARAEAEEGEQADVAAENARLAAEFRSEQQAAESAYQEGLVQTPAETRLAMARAAGTEDTGDDLAALRSEEQRLVGNLGRGSIETEIQIQNALNGIRAEIKRVAENTGTLVDIEKNRESYLQALRSLRGDQSNIFNPLAELRGNTIRVENYFKSGPVDAHLWSKDLEFELKALVG